MADPFPRCCAQHADGRRCYLRPGHRGHHCILPKSTLDAVEAAARIAAKRADVRPDLIHRTALTEAFGALGVA